MKTFVTAWMAILLLCATARGQAPIESSTRVHEAFPTSVPIEIGETADEMPTPVGLAVQGLQGVFRGGGNVVELPPLNSQDIAAADAEHRDRYRTVRPGPLRVGVVRAIEPAPVSLRDAVVLRLPLGGGRELRTFAVRAPGAHAIRLHFTQFDVGAGSALVYAETDGELIVRGPYGGRGPNGNGDFWTASLPGETVCVEVTGAGQPHLEIGEIGHFDRSPAGPGVGDADDKGAPKEFSCHLDVMCYGDPPVSARARSATGQMNFVCGRDMCICSGTLLTDRDDETYVPHFLTAFHCLNTQAQVDSLEVVWLWQRPSCGGTLPRYSALPRSVGGTLLETNPTDGGNDMTFIRLAGTLPGGVGLAGWTTGHPDDAVGIHHPDGSWKRVTFLSDVGVCPGCESCGDGTDYDYYDMDDGLVEGGSSGSGVFNRSGQLAGQLYGHCCVVPACADGEYNCAEKDEWVAYYGEFETTYPIIQRWLEIGGTIHVDGAHLSPPWLGTPSAPFPFVGMAYDFAWNGARIKIRAGAYPETLTLNKRLTLVAHGGTVAIGR